MDTARNAWVERVLGIKLGAESAVQDPAIAPSSAAAGGGADVLKLWQDGKDSADSRFNTLATRLRAFDDIDLNQIADKGLYGLTSGGGTVALTKALMNYQSARGPDRTKAAGALQEALRQYRDALADSDLIDLLDGNPFGVKLDLFATLDAALKQIEASLPTSR